VILAVLIKILPYLSKILRKKAAILYVFMSNSEILLT